MLHFRYLRASEDIKAGDTIFEEYPLNRGPVCTPDPTQPVCLGCYQFLGNKPSERHDCMKCGWPLCSTACEKSPEHLPECQMFSAKNVKISSESFDYDDIEPMYDIICPLRILWQREHQPDKWRIFWKLMSQVENWIESKWNGSRKMMESHQMIIKYIINVLKLGRNNTFYTLNGPFTRNIL